MVCSTVRRREDVDNEMRCTCLRCMVHDCAVQCDVMRCDAMLCDAMRCYAMQNELMLLQSTRCDAMRTHAQYRLLHTQMQKCYPTWHQSHDRSRIGCSDMYMCHELSCHTKASYHMVRRDMSSVQVMCACSSRAMPCDMARSAESLRPRGTDLQSESRDIAHTQSHVQKACLSLGMGCGSLRICRSTGRLRGGGRSKGLGTKLELPVPFADRNYAKCSTLGAQRFRTPHSRILDGLLDTKVAALAPLVVASVASEGGWRLQDANSGVRAPVCAWRGRGTLAKRADRSGGLPLCVCVYIYIYIYIYICIYIYIYIHIYIYI